MASWSRGRRRAEIRRFRLGLRTSEALPDRVYARSASGGLVGRVTELVVHDASLARQGAVAGRPALAALTRNSVMVDLFGE